MRAIAVALLVCAAGCQRSRLVAEEGANAAIEGATARESDAPPELLAEVNRVVRRAGSCLPKEFAAASVSVRATIAQGHVLHASVKADVPLPPAVEACIVDAVERTALSNADDGDSFVVEAPLG